MDEQIKTMMRALDITEQEARELIEEDNKVDKMTSTKQINSDLNPEQQKALKKYKNTGSHKVDAYGKKRMVERKPDETKRRLIRSLRAVVDENADVGTVEVTNIERQIDFRIDGRKYRIVLSAPRKT